MSHCAPLDDQLSILLLRVAQQIDSKLGGRSFDSNLLSSFGKELKRTTGIGEVNATSYFQSDPIKTEVFAQAVEESFKRAISDMSDLTTAIDQIIQSTNLPNDGQSKDKLSQVKQFCLSLHRSMMSQSLPPIYEGEDIFENELGFVR